MADMPSSDEISVVYDSADFRSLYRACRSCKRNALLLLLAVPAVFGALSYSDGVRGVGLVYDAFPYLLIAAITVLTFYLFSPWYTVRLRRKNGWNEPMIVQLAEEGISIVAMHPSPASAIPRPSLITTILPPRARTSCMLLTVFSNSGPDGARTITGTSSSISAIGPCFISPAA